MYLTRIGFKPEWTSKQPKSGDNATTVDPRLVLYFNTHDDDIDFTTLHNIIYYIYTNSVNLRRCGRCTFPAQDTTFLPGYPSSPSDPFHLYRNATKFLLTTLSDYCFQYLQASTSYLNVVDRLFRADTELRHHDALREMYLEKLIKDYDMIKKSGRWREVMCNEWDVESDVREYHELICFEITKRLTPAPVKRPRSTSPAEVEPTRCAQQ